MFLFKHQRNTFLLAAYCYSWNLDVLANVFY